MSKYLFKKVVRIPIYRSNLIIILSNSNNKINKLIDSFGKENVYAHALGCNYKNKSAYAIVLNFNNKYRKIKHGFIVK